jgi:hypothetical protein
VTKPRFSLLKIVLFSGIALLSGLFRAKIIVDIGGIELLGVVSTLLAVSTFAATIIFGNFWSVTFLQGQTHYSACLPTILFRPLFRSCKILVLTLTPILIFLILFRDNIYLEEVLAVALTVVSQIAVFCTVTFLRGIGNELLLSKMIMSNNLLTTMLIFLLQLNDSNDILLISALCNFLHWILVLIVCRSFLSILDFDNTKDEYRQMEIKSRELILIPLAPLLFDIYWRLLLVIDTGWSDIGLLQPSIQYLLVMEPMLIHLAIALGNNSIRKSISQRDFKITKSRASLFIIAIPFSISSIVLAASGFYLKTFFGQEFAEYEFHFRLLLISSVFRFSLILVNMKIQSSFSNNYVDKVMKISILMRIILTTVFLYLFGALGIVLAIAIESMLSFLIAFRKLRIQMR